MQKYKAIITVHSWTGSTDDTAAIDNFLKFVRREHLPAVHNTRTCKPYNLSFPDDVLSKLEPFSEARPLLSRFEHRCSLTFESRDLKKVHLLLSLIQSYTAYKGIHYRLFSLKSVP